MYISREGFQRLQDELNYLWREKRPEVTRLVSEAAALGDRSENAEYIYGKKQLREIDRRVRYLTKRLESLKIVDQLPDDRSKVYFGAWVELEDSEGDARWVRIVGSDEFDFDSRYISLHSPLAKALLGKSVDAEITLNLTTGRVQYWIVDIEYS